MIKNIIKKLLVYGGPMTLFRILRRSLSSPGITIIYGHRVLPDDIMASETDPRRITGHTSVSDLTKTIKVLSKYYDFISLEEAVQQIQQGKIKKDSIVLTFDDGFEDNYLHLLPILKEHKIPAAYFVNSSVIGTQDSLWFQAIINYFYSQQGKTLYVEINNTEYDISNAEITYASAFKFMRYLQAEVKPEEFLPIINKMAGKDCKPAASDKHLTWEELEQLNEEPLITLGAHTVNHYPLSLCNLTLAKEEILKSIADLQNRLKISIKHFSYPRGFREDFNDEHVRVLQEAGIKSAVSTIRGISYAGDDLYQLRRIGLPQSVIGKEHDLLWDVAGLSGSLYAVLTMFKNK